MVFFYKVRNNLTPTAFIFWHRSSLNTSKPRHSVSRDEDRVRKQHHSLVTLFGIHRALYDQSNVTSRHAVFTRVTGLNSSSWRWSNPTGEEGTILSSKSFFALASTHGWAGNPDQTRSQIALASHGVTWECYTLPNHWQDRDSWPGLWMRWESRTRGCSVAHKHFSLCVEEESPTMSSLHRDSGGSL